MGWRGRPEPPAHGPGYQQEDSGGRGEPAPGDGPRSARARHRRSELHPVGADRALDVLDPLLTRKLDRRIELALELVVGRAGDQHPTRFTDLLQAGRNVHPVPEEVMVLNHHVAEINSDAEDDTALGRDAILTIRHTL